MGMVIQSAKAMSSIKGKAMKGASGLILFAVAIKVLASAVKDLSTLSWDELIKGLVGVAGLIAAVTVFSKALSGSQNVFAASSKGIFSSKTQKNQIGRAHV